MMNDRVISLQAAIDALCSICGNDCDKSEFVYDAPQDEQVILCPEHYALTQLPSAQPEIIHCEECAYRKDNFMGDWCTCWCGWTSLDGHCHKGANKDE